MYGKYEFPFENSTCFRCRAADTQHRAMTAYLLASVYNCPATIYRRYVYLNYIYPYALQYSDLNNTTYPNLSKTVFVIFMVLVPILLLNMLIAMMGNTYAHVIEQSEKEFVKQVGIKVIFLTWHSKEVFFSASKNKLWRVNESRILLISLI